MIKRFVKQFMDNKDELRKVFETSHPDDYHDIVKVVIELLYQENEDSHEPTPDPGRIHEIDDGDYQGTLVFVIAETGYQPNDYWAVKVDYGSCSCCDTFQSIRYSESGSNDKPTAQQVDDYMTLALHIIQRMKSI